MGFAPLVSERGGGETAAAAGGVQHFVGYVGVEHIDHRFDHEPVREELSLLAFECDMGELLVCRAHQIPVVRIVLPADERIVLEHGSRFDEGGVADGDVLVLVEDRGILFRVLMEQATDGFRHGGPPVFGLVLFRSDPEMGVGGVGSHRLVIDLGEKDTHHVHGKVGIRVLHAPAVKTVMAHRQQSAHITGSFQLSYARSPPILPSLTAPRQTGGLLEDLNAVLVLSPVEDRAVTIRPDATIGAGVEDVRDQLGVSVLHLVPFAFDHEVDLALVTVQAGGLGRVDDDVRAHRKRCLTFSSGVLLRPPPKNIHDVAVLIETNLESRVRHASASLCPMATVYNDAAVSNGSRREISDRTRHGRG